MLVELGVWSLEAGPYCFLNERRHAALVTLHLPCTSNLASVCRASDKGTVPGKRRQPQFPSKYHILPNLHSIDLENIRSNAEVLRNVNYERSAGCRPNGSSSPATDLRCSYHENRPHYHSNARWKVSVQSQGQLIRS